MKLDELVPERFRDATESQKSAMFEWLRSQALRSNNEAWFHAGLALHEITRLHQLVNTPEVEDFDKGVPLESAHQVARWGEAHDRSKSAENWYWLLGYLAGKALRAAIAGDREKALHHTISAAAALRNWHAAIKRNTSGAGVGADPDLVLLDAGVESETSFNAAPQAGEHSTAGPAKHGDPAVAAPFDKLETLPMLMFCPRCSKQHIDEPKGEWTNPPHATHTCQHCGLLWRPSNHNTTGVAFVKAAEDKHVERIAASFPVSARGLRGDILREVEQRIHDCYNMQKASAWPHCEGVARAKLIVRAMIDEESRYVAEPK